MNNLLQSLASQRLKLKVPDADLKRLLADVKASRGHDSKLQDPFYESLEGIVADLRTVTIDNHDAEAFLKPVSKVDYPDYYNSIANPMDLQTVLKKVKQKHYKSKKEFADDLDLIWSNCYAYNTGENHPLRLCVNRLREKANKLLKHVTDRKDRLDPPIPSEAGANGPTSKLNGIIVNGHARKHTTPPVVKIIGKAIPRPSAKPTPQPSPPREIPFHDMPAFVRSPSGMASFANLDSELQSEGAGPSTGPSLAERLEQLIGSNCLTDDRYDGEAVNGDVGEKRKMGNGDFHPRKRSRMRLDRKTADLTPDELWWEATQSSDLIANGLPMLTHSSSLILDGDFQLQTPPPDPVMKPAKRKKRKRPPKPSSLPNSLLGLMNDNIRALKRVRRTHDKFLALNPGTEEGATGLNGQPLFEPHSAPPLAMEDDEEVQVDERPWRARGTGVVVGAREADDCLHWMGTKVMEHAGFQSTSKAALDVFSGVAMDYFQNVGRTIKYFSDQHSRTLSAEEIILHTLFESGIPQVSDLERYITDDIVRYGARLVDLEKKLDTAYQDVTTTEALDDDAFFAEDEEEDGELLMGNFADSFGDDFLGLRELGIASEVGLSNLTIPKKLLRGKNKDPRIALEGAKPTEPPPPYPPPPPLVPLSSMVVDSQIGLVKDFYARRFNSFASSSQPPKLQPFIPAPAPAAQPPPPPSRAFSPNFSLQLEMQLEMQLEGFEPPTPSAPTAPSTNRVRNPEAPPLSLPDDAPATARTKIGPLGQITRPSANAGSHGKKKAKPKDSGGAGVPSGTSQTQSVGPAAVLHGAASNGSGKASALPNGIKSPMKPNSLPNGTANASNGPINGVGMGTGKKKPDTSSIPHPIITASA